MAADDATRDSLTRQLEAALRTFSESETAPQHAAALEARDRSWIARWVIVIFGGAIFLAFVVMAVEGAYNGNWTAVSGQVLDLIRSGVLPVVTLILGYYFGRSGRI